MKRLRLKPWIAHNIYGNPYTAKFSNVDVPELLAEIREQAPGGTPIKLQAAFDLFMHTLAEMIQDEGGGARAAVIANKGMVSFIQSMGYRIMIDGSEFEVGES